MKQNAMNKKIPATYFFLRQNVEALIWISVLIYFAVSPVSSDVHFTICPLSLAGFAHCPGCGLGRALILLMHGYFIEAFNMHPLSPFALLVIPARVFSIFRNHHFYRKQMST
jgi:hypothetical protein